ncbi:hypothetical protein IP88_06710 [alpha proteobacterium AAP81b]|nr:hypothetical protein IP88_06710 [alpha proteobacterium AAP81b]
MAWTIALATLAGAAAAPPAPAPPLAAYGRLPSVETLRLSPDGKRLAMIVGGEEAREIQVRNVPGMAMAAVIPAQKNKVRDLIWAGSDHLIVMTSTTASVAELSDSRRYEWSQLADIDLRTGKSRQLLGRTEGSMNVVAGRPRPVLRGGKPMLIVEGYTFPNSQATSTLFRIDLGNGGETIVETGTTLTVDWLLDETGRAVARADYDSREQEWRLFVRPGANWTRRYEERSAIDTPGLLAMDSDGARALISSHKSGEWETYRVGLGDGVFSEPVAELDGESIIVDSETGRMIGQSHYGLTEAEVQFRDPADQALWQRLVRAFKGESVSFVSWTPDRQRVVVAVEGPTNGNAFFLVDRTAKTATWLTNAYAGINPEHWQPVEAFHYKAADGFDIPAYLTLPRGAAAAKALPLIVLAHGGPAGRDYPGFDWWAQALAARGYAVLQPQFRGSTGFGEAHMAAGFGQWGRKMQSDVSDGVRHLAAAGRIDPRRACIVGASYGGYAALAGVTVETGVYRCAAGVAGVYDLKRMLNTEASEGGWQSAGLRYWRRFMGATRNDDPALEAIAPARLADRAKGVPVLLVHGKDDSVVRYEQTQIMAKALTAAGNPPEVVTLAGEDHWLSRSATRQQMLNAVVGFLEKHNPPGTAAIVGK